MDTCSPSTYPLPLLTMVAMIAPLTISSFTVRPNPAPEVEVVVLSVISPVVKS